MKTIFLLVIFLSHITYAQVSRTVDIGSLNQSPQVIDGVDFPRLQETKYRGGSEDQYSSQQAIIAMLGGDEPIESILFSGIKLLLMKKSCRFCSIISAELETFGFNEAIKEEFRKNSDKSFSLNQARAIAFKIMEDNLRKNVANGSFIDLKVDYLSARYEGFPRDVIFSSVYLEVANVYSRFITVVKGNSHHSLDLNYWNKIRNGGWLFIARKWVDRGEFITPILIESENIIGFHEYLSQVPDYTVYRPLPAELDFSYLKIQENGEDLVLVFDGKINQVDRATAIIKDSNDQFVLSKSRFDPDADIPKLLKPLKEKPKLIGIFKLCPMKDDCRLNSRSFSIYPRSMRPISKNLIAALTSLNIRNMRPKLFLADTPIKQSEAISDPFIPKKISEKELMNGLESEQSFSSFIRIDSPTIQSGKKVTWDLAQRKLAKDGAIYLTFPASFRKKKLKTLTLLQRQDPGDNSTALVGRRDHSPAYTGVQFYSLSDTNEGVWRYISHNFKFNPPKDSYFADIATADEMKPFVIPFTGVVKDHDSETETIDPMNIAAVRLLGLGTDPSTLYKLELEFE